MLGKGGEYAFEYDLKDFDITKAYVRLSVVYIGCCKFYIYLQKTVVKINYECFLAPDDSSDVFPGGTIHYRFDLINKSRNKVSQTMTFEKSLFKMLEGWGLPDWIDSRMIQDHVLKVKVWIDKSFSDFASRDRNPLKPSTEL
jgi:hypothetical protein